MTTPKISDTPRKDEIMADFGVVATGRLRALAIRAMDALDITERELAEANRALARERKEGDILLQESLSFERQLDEAKSALADVRRANAALVRWKGEIDSRLIAHRVKFPDDYEDSPKWAVARLIELEVGAK